MMFSRKANHPEPKPATTRSLALAEMADHLQTLRLIKLADRKGREAREIDRQCRWARRHDRAQLRSWGIRRNRSLNSAEVLFQSNPSSSRPSTSSSMPRFPLACFRDASVCRTPRRRSKAPTLARERRSPPARSAPLNPPSQTGLLPGRGGLST
jgi:hypothetical protein